MRGRRKRLDRKVMVMGVILLMLARISIAEEPKEKTSEAAGKDYFAQEVPHKIYLIAGKSQVLQFKEDVVRTAVNNPEIAALVLINPREILVNAKAPGVTTIIAWNEQGKRAVFDVVVDIDTSRLASLIQKVVPEEKEIYVHATNDRIVLSGEVEKSTSIIKAGNIAEAYLPEVVNLLRVKQPKQILLQVRFAEVNRTALKELGLDLLAQGETFALHSYVSGQTIPRPYDIFPGPPPQISSLPGETNLFLELWTKDRFSLAPILRALEERRLLRTIAEPNLLALEGEQASFLAGGEIPITTVSDEGTNVEWREYGVRLSFIPVITDNGTIRLELEPEVSTIDTGTERVEGVPALRTRRAHTVVELTEGESLIIGGLIQQETTKTSGKTPFLGDIPILGKLFSSESYQRGESELLVMVTPILVESRNIQAAQRPRLSEELPATLAAKGFTYQDGRGERYRDFLHGQKVKPIIPEAEIKDEECLFYRPPLPEFFREFYERREFRREKAEVGEHAFSEREVKIYQQLSPRYKLMRKYYYGGI